MLFEQSIGSNFTVIVVAAILSMEIILQNETSVRMHVLQLAIMRVKVSCMNTLFRNRKLKAITVLIISRSKASYKFVKSSLLKCPLYGYTYVRIRGEFLKVHGMRQMYIFSFPFPIF